jgi:hypothetical protein
MQLPIYQKISVLTALEQARARVIEGTVIDG